jgi:hypothetical protein
MSYVQVPRDLFIAKLTECGFHSDETQEGNELVVTRQHHNDGTMFVKIFTTLPKAGGDVRAKGADAIRIVLIFKNGDRSGCLMKLPKVLRTGSAEAVIERTIERAREAYAEANRRHNERVLTRRSREALEVNRSRS